MSTNAHFIQPADLLFFKDGRELQAGTEYSAESIFPPMPTTLYGAIRSRLIMDREPDWDSDDFGLAANHTEMLGTKQDLGNLTISLLALARQTGDTVHSYFPVPADVTIKKSDVELHKKGVFVPSPVLTDSSLQGTAPVKTNLSLSLHLTWKRHGEREVLKKAEGFLTKEGFENYLMDNLKSLKTAGENFSDEFNHVKAPQVFESEPRMHVTIDNSTHGAEAGKLFTISFKRFAENFGLVIATNPAGLLGEAGVLRLGGESRPAHFRKVPMEQPDRSKIEQKVRKNGKYFKLVTATPSVFSQGWIPDGIDKDGIGKIGGCKVKLIGAGFQRYIIAGGWDLAEKKPKKSYRAVPPGAVYHFELIEGSVEQLFDQVYGRSICTDKKEFQKQGFGITYIGVS